jgi:galactose-1-phosphate uridylyltransferase
MFKTGTGDWTQYRAKGVVEVDFHRSEHVRRDSLGFRLDPREQSYEAAMAAVRDDALAAIKNAYECGEKWVMFTHGSSTSGPGKSTARSKVRGLMRSKKVTPYVYRRECIQHETVFVVAIRSH